MSVREAFQQWICGLKKNGDLRFGWRILIQFCKDFGFQLRIQFVICSSLFEWYMCSCCCDCWVMVEMTVFACSDGRFGQIQLTIRYSIQRSQLVIVVHQCKWGLVSDNNVHNATWHQFIGLFFRTTWVSRYQKGKTSLDLNEARHDGVLGCSGISWTTCKQSAPRSRQITTQTPHHWIFTG